MTQTKHEMELRRELNAANADIRELKSLYSAATRELFSRSLEIGSLERRLANEKFLRRLYMWAFFASFLVSLFFALSNLV